MISQILNFETDNSKFYDEQDEILDALGNTKPINFNKQKSNNSTLKLNIEMNDVEKSFDSFLDSPIIESQFCQIEYGGHILKFDNRTVLSDFINDNVEYNEPYYIFNIPKKTHCVVVKMRNIESICDYLIKFHQIQN